MAAAAFTELHAARRPSAHCSFWITLIKDLTAHLILLAADHLIAAREETLRIIPLIL